MSDSGTLGELLRSRIVQCDALEQEVETWKQRHAQAVEVAEGNARRVAFWQEQSDLWKQLAYAEREKVAAAARSEVEALSGDPLEFDRHAMVLADLASVYLIDKSQSGAKQAEHLVRAYLWAKDNAIYDAVQNTTTYPSWLDMQELWPEIQQGATNHDPE